MSETLRAFVRGAASSALTAPADIFTPLLTLFPMLGAVFLLRKKVSQTSETQLYFLKRQP